MIAPDDPAWLEAEASQTPARLWKSLCRFVENEKIQKKWHGLSGKSLPDIYPFGRPNLPVFTLSRVLISMERILLTASNSESILDILLYHPFDEFVVLWPPFVYLFSGTSLKQIFCYQRIERLDFEFAFSGEIDLTTVGYRTTCGNIDVVLSAREGQIVGNPGGAINLADKDSEGHFPRVKGLIRGGMHALGTIGLPTNSIVKVSSRPARPKKPRKKRSGTRIPRLCDREIFILQTREEVRREWKAAHGMKSVMPHWRRGHWRLLQHQRYGSKVGQRVWVRPTKVGEPEVAWDAAGKRYCLIA